MSGNLELTAEQAVEAGLPAPAPPQGSDATASSAASGDAFLAGDDSIPSAARKLIPSFWRLVLGMALGLAVGLAVILIVNPHIASDVHDAQRAAVQPVYLLLALACTALAIITDAWSLLLLARVFRPQIGRRPVVSTALESHLIGGATSFGGFEIPYQIVMLRGGGLTGSQAMSVVIFKGLVHTLLLAIVALVSLLPWTDSPITSLQRWLLLGATGALLLVWVVVWLWVQRPLGRAFVPKRLHGKLDELVELAVQPLGHEGASQRALHPEPDDDPHEEQRARSAQQQPTLQRGDRRVGPRQQRDKRDDGQQKRVHEALEDDHRHGLRAGEAAAAQHHDLVRDLEPAEGGGAADEVRLERRRDRGAALDVRLEDARQDEQRPGVGDDDHGDAQQGQQEVARLPGGALRVVHVGGDVRVDDEDHGDADAEPAGHAQQQPPQTRHEEPPRGARALRRDAGDRRDGVERSRLRRFDGVPLAHLPAARCRSAR